jgi:hypothetical protein
MLNRASELEELLNGVNVGDVTLGDIIKMAAERKAEAELEAEYDG